MNRDFTMFSILIGLCALVAVPATAHGDEHEAMSTTLAVMDQRIEESVGQWGRGYQLYVLWPDSKKGASAKKLPKPEGWLKAANGSLKQKVKLTGKTVHTARLSLGFLLLTKTKKDAVKGDKDTIRRYAVLEHDPIFTPGDPQVATWLERVGAEYEDKYTFYVLYPRALPVPPGWRDAYYVGGSLIPANLYEDLANMDGKGALTFKGHSKKKWKRKYLIIEAEEQTESSE